MQLDTIELPQCLREGTKAFVDQYAAAIEARLGPAVSKMDASTRDPKDDAGKIMRRNFLRSEPVWEKFFWARMAHHYGELDGDLSESLKLADEDILSLSAILHAL